MPVPNVQGVALREGFAANLYGLDATYRRDDGFDDALASVCSWALEIDGYDDSSIDVFTGEAYVTVCGTPRSRETLDAIHRVVARHPRRRFHARTPLLPDGSCPADVPTSWAGATLLTTHGVALGCLNLWSARPVVHADSTHAHLPLLARAAVQVLEERRRILERRAAPELRPRPVADRPVDRAAPDDGAPGRDVPGPDRPPAP